MTPIDGPTHDRMHCVYFARVGDLPEIKIGCSSNIRWRLQELSRNGIRRAAFPLALVRGGTQLELRFHAQFEPHHIGNEWFAPAPEILEAIVALHAGVFDFDSLPKRGWCITKPFRTRASLAHWGPAIPQTLHEAA